MKILDKMFNWFSIKDERGEEIHLGYVLDGEPSTIQDIEKVLNAFQLGKYFEAIKPLVRSKIDLILTPTDESKFTIAKSKIGGKPNLTKDQIWPQNELGQSLSFIGQLNFEEVSKFDQSGLLPKSGMLSFFYCANQSAWGFDPNDKQRFKLVFTENTELAIKRDFPKDLEDYAIFKPNSISFNSSLSIPTWQEDSIQRIIKKEDSDKYMELSSGIFNQILGYANCVQGTMELECQLVTNGLFCGDSTAYQDPRRFELEAGKEDWVLLLQIDSDKETTGMMWGDLGRIYFWIKKQDLANKEFDKAWCILQCH